MRFSTWLPVVLALAAVACSSSGGGGTSPGKDASTADSSMGDASMADQAVASCGDIAACYSVTVALDPRSAATCSGAGTLVADYTALTGNGPVALGGCQGQLAACVLTQTCQSTQSWTLTFTGQGLSGTIIDTTFDCAATVVGTRLATCPPPAEGGAPAEAGAEGGGPTSPDAGEGGPAGNGGEDQEAGIVEASSVDAGLDATQPDGGSDGASAEAGDDGGEPDGSDGAPE